MAAEIFKVLYAVIDSPVTAFALAQTCQTALALHTEHYAHAIAKLRVAVTTVAAIKACRYHKATWWLVVDDVWEEASACPCGGPELWKIVRARCLDIRVMHPYTSHRAHRSINRQTNTAWDALHRLAAATTAWVVI